MVTKENLEMSMKKLSSDFNTFLTYDVMLSVVQKECK